MANGDIQLSEAERRRIRAEEIFRVEVQRDLQQKPPSVSGSSKILSALNMPLALWFLSSVVLAGIGWSYAKWEESRAIQAQNRAKVMQLDIEIFSRLKQSARRLESATNPLGLREAIEMLDEGSGVFPELEDRSFEGILLQLTWLVPEEEKAELENARSAFSELKGFRHTSSEDAAENITLVKRDYLNSTFAIRQWRE